jgi:prepilin-type N-terminal cleavage/methylation domain-containing protein
MRVNLSVSFKPKDRRNAFTLVEVVISIAIVASVFGGITLAYIQAARRAEWSGYSLAAQALANQQIEQIRAARWELGLFGNPYIDETEQLNLIAASKSGATLRGYTWANLDIPYSGTNFVRATNFVTITSNNLSLNPVVSVRFVRVDTVWPFRWKSTTRLHTNTLCTYCAPDN